MEGLVWSGGLWRGWCGVGVYGGVGVEWGLMKGLVWSGGLWRGSVKLGFLEGLLWR